MKRRPPIVREAVRAGLCVLGIGSCAGSAIPASVVVPAFPLNFAVASGVALLLPGGIYWAWCRRRLFFPAQSRADGDSEGNWPWCVATGALTGWLLATAFLGTQPELGPSTYDGLVQAIGLHMGAGFGAVYHLMFNWIERRSMPDAPSERARDVSDPAI